MDSNKNMGTYIFLGMLTLVVLMVGAWYFFLRPEEPATASNQNNTPTPTQTTTTTPTTTNTETPTTQAGTFTAAQVAQHSTASDCWLIINNNVYDVTSFVGQHPGGAIITSQCGQDATQAFQSQGGQGNGHSAVAQNMLDGLKIGTLAQ